MNLRHSIYKWYSERIKPRVSHFRGTTRLEMLLQDIALMGVPKINEETNPFKEENWDNLIILDACRYDIYKQVTGCDQYVYSPGSHSGHCLENTFSEGDWSDVVYITANPHFDDSIFEGYTGRKPDEVFHSIYRTFETDWDDEEGTVMPGSIVRDAKNAEKLFPEKRKMIHFMQPHHPFIDSDIYSRKGFFRKSTGADSVWAKVEKGEVQREKAVEAYRNNIEIVLDYVKDLSDSLDGKTVVTSDHANFMGENGFYGHPPYRQEVPVRKVPWDVISED